jgi:hypothetical protein
MGTRIDSQKHSTMLLSSITGEVPVWVEPFAATASAMLFVHGGNGNKRLVSWQGNKWGYREAIAREAGCFPAQGIKHAILNDAGDWGALWAYIARPSSLLEIGNHLICWDQDLQARRETHPEKDERWLFDALCRDLRERRLTTASPAYLFAAFLLCCHWSFQGKGWRAGYGGPGCSAGVKLGGNWTVAQRDVALGILKLHERLENLRLPEVITATQQDANQIRMPRLTKKSVIFIDPPYGTTTGYKDKNGDPPPAVDVEALALRWHEESGARVLVSYHQPLSRLLAAGWTQRDITSKRTTQARMRSAQQRELLVVSP